MDKLSKLLTVYYPIILAFYMSLYSVSLGLLGYTEEAQYSAHWPATILLFTIAIRQRRSDFNKKVKEDDEYLNVYYWICHFQHVHMGVNLHDKLGS